MKMAVKHCIPRVLEERCRHFFEARWPTGDSLEINPYKLKVLTGLGQGTCLKIFNDLYYVPDLGVMNTLCERFNLQPGDFLYYEKNSTGPVATISPKKRPSKRKAVKKAS